MFVRTEVVVPPAAQVVDLNFVKQYVRISNTVDDAILSSFIDIATDMAQERTNRAILTQTLQYTVARNTVPLNNYMYNVGWNNGGNLVYPWNMFSNQYVINLPKSPVQTINSVSVGTWGTYPDTFLVQGTDYFVDIASTPTRLHLNFNPYFQCDHLTVNYTTGYDQTNTINTTGTASTSGTALAVIGGVGLSASVTSGDTAQTVLESLYAAIGAATGTPSAQILTPNLIQLRGSDVTVASASTPVGLTITSGTPASSIPASLAGAIAYGAATLYQNLANPLDDMPELFYRMLDQHRIVVFG